MAKKSPNGDRDRIGDDMRGRILAAALKLLAQGGRDAVTTRAVAEAAGVQPPVLYRQFGDKDGMLDALAEHGFSHYLSQKRQRPQHADPVESLRKGWDQHVEFGLQNPMLYLLMYAQARQGKISAAASLAFEMLRNGVAQVAAAGQLMVTEEQAVSLYHAAAVGVVLTLLNLPPDARDMMISTMARDIYLAAITTPGQKRSLRAPALNAAVTLSASLPQDSTLSEGEKTLLKEWLGRIVKERTRKPSEG